MKEFEYYYPGKIVFKEYAHKDICSYLEDFNSSAVLIVADPIMVKLGKIDPITASLKENSIDFIIFSDIAPSPPIETVTQCIEEYKKVNCDVIVAVGGGSTIDTAKACAVLATNEAPIAQYEGADKVPNPTPPIIAFPTTAGTGSEISGSTVLTDTERQFKISIRSNYLVPKLTILDPTLLLDTPKKIIAESGMDTLCHAIESYISVNSSAISEAFAEKSIALCGEFLPKFYENPKDLKAAGKMQEACALAGISFMNARLGGVHALAHSIGGMYKIPHGRLCATLLPSAVYYNAPAVPEKCDKISTLLGTQVANSSEKTAGDIAAQAISDLLDNLDIPQNFKDFEIQNSDIDHILDNAIGSQMHLTNPRSTDRDALADQLKSLI